MSLQISHILVPTDFSETADNALSFALEIALRKKARLTVMHTIEEPYNYASMIEDYQQRVKRNAENLLHEKIDEILEQKRYQQLNINTHLLYGPTVFSILDQIEETDIDFVVMGTTGATGLKRVLFGSNTTEIIQRSEIPVLAIPEESEFKGLSQIIFLTDYNDGDLKALEKTTELAIEFDSEISVLHVTRELNLREEIMRRGFKDIATSQVSYTNLKFELAAEDNLIKGINEFLSRQPSSLISMVKYKKPFFTELLHKSHSKEMGFYTTVPLLILPGEEPY